MQILNHCKITSVLQKRIDDLRQLAATKNKLMDELCMELARVKEECESLRGSHAKEIKAYRDNLKIHDMLVIYQTKINMADQALNSGFDKNSWDIEGQRARVVKLEAEKNKDYMHGETKAGGEADEEDKMELGVMVSGFEGKLSISLMDGS